MMWITANKIAKLIHNDQLVEIKRLLELYSLEERWQIISEKVKRCSLLYLAVKKARLSIVDYFLDKCDIKPDYLWLAAAAGDLRIVASLLKHGADINSVDHWHRTALFKACSLSHLKMAKYLIDKGADLNMADYHGTTCLMVSLRNLDVCHYLLSQDASVDQMNGHGKTALILAVESQNIPCIQMLLSFKADASRTNEYGENAILFASRNNQTGVLEKLKLQGYRVSNEIALNNEIKSCHLSVNRHLEKAETFWKTAMNLQNLPTDTPIFQIRDLANTDERLRDVLNHFESIDMRAIAFLQSRLNLLNPYTLTLFSEAAARISDLNDFLVVLRGFFQFIKSAKDRLFFRIFLENCDLMETFARRNSVEQNFEVKLSRLLEIFELFVAQIKDAGKRIQKMNPMEKISYCLYIESYFCNFLDFIQTIEEEYPGELYKFTGIVKSLLDENLRGFGNASLLHVCIIKGYPMNITQMLLYCGADLNDKDDEGRTSVDYALEVPVYKTKSFIDMFLNYGLRFDVNPKDDPCLVCCLNKMDLLRRPVKYSSLQCLAATSVAETRVDYENYLPPNLQIMVYTHTRLSLK